MDTGTKSTSAPVLNSTLLGLMNMSDDMSGVDQINDEDEYIKMKTKWERIGKIYQTMHKTNYAIAVILACFTISVLVTLRESKLREKSVMWYMYHMACLSVFVIILHTLALYADMPNDEGVCLFVMYGAEYMYLAFAVNLILVNTEIFFTVVLPLEYWRTKQFLRFMVSTLSGWIVVCLIVGHLVIDNNDARRDDAYCYYSRNKTVRKVRFVLRGIIPAGIGFLYTCASIGVYVFKRVRSIRTNSSETLKEILFNSNAKDEVNWLRMSACLNLLFVTRVVAWGILKAPLLYKDYENNIYAVVILISIHVQCFNLLPVAMLCIPEVRESLKSMFLIIVKFITRGRTESSDERETLAVSYGNINATD